MQGGEIGYIHDLNYKWAYVQMNHGLTQSVQRKFAITQTSTIADSAYLVIKSNLIDRTSIEGRLKYLASFSDTLKRESWHILSSPLKDVVSGDFSFGGYPLTFMRKFLYNKFEDPYNVGEWSILYNSLIEKMSDQPTDGYAFYMYGFLPGGSDSRNLGCLEDGVYSVDDRSIMEIPITHPTKGLGQRFGLNHTNGIMELPFFEEDIELASRRTQTYGANSPRRSVFYYTSSVEGTPFNELTGNKDSTDRSSNFSEYRFIADNYSGGQWFTGSIAQHQLFNIAADQEFMVGNPFMSALDMEAFLLANSSNVRDHYRIWDWEENSFVTHKYNGSGFTSTKDAPEGGQIPVTKLNPGFVAPLQGFFLTTAKYTNGTAAIFDAAVISTKTRTINSKSNLRSAQEMEAERNIIRIKAENDWASSYMFIGYNKEASDEFDRETDVQRMFSPTYYAPEVYALAGDIPTDVRYIHDRKEEIIIPIGIKTGFASELWIKLSGMDNYSKAKKVEFIDALEGRTIDLTGMPNYTYVFYHSETGIFNGRFSLRITNSMTANPEYGPDDLKVYGNRNGFYVLSPASDPVKQVLVYDFQGRLMYESASGAQYYPLSNNIGNNPYIVKAVTENNAKTVKMQ
jgi:hypothetical protein